MNNKQLINHLERSIDKNVQLLDWVHFKSHLFTAHSDYVTLANQLRSEIATDTELLGSAYDAQNIQDQANPPIKLVGIDLSSHSDDRFND